MGLSLKALERMENTIRGEKVDRLPILVLTKMFGLKQSNLPLNTCLNSTPDIYVDSQRRCVEELGHEALWAFSGILEINEAYCRMSGYSQDELLKMNIKDLDDFAGFSEKDPQVQNIRVNGSDRFETRHRRKDGSYFDVEVSVRYHPIEKGQVITFIQDISERNKAAKAPLSSKAFADSNIPGVQKPHCIAPWSINAC